MKQAQAQYLIERIESFVGSVTGRLPMQVVAAGDFNALPSSVVYKILTENSQPRGLNNHIPSLLRGPNTKFLCDKSLSRLCRWMRVLGVDCALESVESNHQRCMNGKKQDFTLFFDKARSDNRVILTTSKQMRERSNCPQSMLITTNSLKNLEQALVDICKEFSLILSPDKFLTVCGKCGGEIEDCSHQDPRFASIAHTLPSDRPVYACANCNQPYWWNDKENSSPARAMKMADKLYKSVQHGLIYGVVEPTRKSSEICSGQVFLQEVDEVTDTDTETVSVSLAVGALHVEDGEAAVSSATAGMEKGVGASAVIDMVQRNDRQGNRAVDFDKSVDLRQADGAMEIVLDPQAKNLAAMFKQREKAMVEKLRARQPHGPSNDGKIGFDNDISEEAYLKTDQLIRRMAIDNAMHPVSKGDVSDPVGAAPLDDQERDQITGSKIDSCISEDDFPRLALKSAYALLHGHEPACTNWCGDFFG